MTDQNGTMVYRGEFDPYGNLVYEWGLAGLNTRKFTGYERDSNTGLDYANARMYGSGRGRFMQPDPAGLKGANRNNPASLNRYSYVNNDPVNSIDPSGNFLANPWCQQIYIDNIYVGNTCGGGWGGFFDLPYPEFSGPAEQPPDPIILECPLQDFHFNVGGNGTTANELSEVVQVALGETSNNFYVDEEETLIATIFNRLNINKVFAAWGRKDRPFNGGDTVLGILEAGYDAYSIHRKSDGLRSGEGKIADVKSQNKGKIPYASYVCRQLLAASSFVKLVGGIDLNTLSDAYPYTYNMGNSARNQIPSSAYGLKRIGDTWFYQMPVKF
ncbi:MAG: RHS repeat-associated core domain-containing protein [Acidobacteria bacterium]|nr:RHS repeat-associated core domain-containing protein [Acidobacteriota bacterium]MBK9708017.1 RHS repeat-associated core domain-containing protein [Acidobacteriota bacterium]